MNRIRRFQLLFFIGLSICFFLHALPAFQSKALGLRDFGSSNQFKTESLPQKIESSDQLIAAGADYYKSGQYKQAISLWLQALELSSDSKIKATLHSNLAAAYRQVGKLSEAIKQWEEAIQFYQAKTDKQSRTSLAAVLADQAQAYNALGQFRQAIERARQAIDIASRYQARQVEAVAQGVLGNAYSINGEYDKALAAYADSLKLANALKNQVYIVTALNNQVNILNTRYQRYLTQAKAAQQEGSDREAERLFKLAQQDRSTALATATRAVQEGRTIGGIPAVRAILNLIHLWEQEPLPKQDLIATYRQQAITILEQLPDSPTKAYALIQLADAKEGLSSEFKIKSLEQAMAVARNIGDSRTESFALGALGHIYELEGQLSAAMKLTRQALFTAQQVNALDSLYRWQWQAGRIHEATGALEAAIIAYKQAIATLQSIRGDIVTANQDLQFDVRDEVEPVYRELMALLLDSSQNQLSNIKEALQYSEWLKLTELQNFFGDECLEVRQAIAEPQHALANANEAVINSIILDQKTYLILRLPDGEVNAYPIALTSKQLQSKIEKFRFSLEDFNNNRYLSLSQEIYNLFLRPMEADLAKSRPSTLVFVNDGVLRNMPMAALHNGKQFLIEKYSIIATLGLNLSPPAKLEVQKALIFGLTVKIPPFDALTNVKDETQIVQNIIGGRRFLDKDFTLGNLHLQIKKGYSIIHLATHGEFSGTADSTFLQAFDSRISLKSFEEILSNTKEPIDLLTLSACQTAAGDNRSTLGIAGLAVRNGVRNVLASLWFVNDADTVTLIKNFYSQVEQPNLSKAEALRNAQMKLIAADSHPSVWSAFILVRS